MSEPYTAMNQETLNLMSELKLNRREMRHILQSVADDMTFDKAEELMKQISEPFIAENSPGCESDVHDMFLWNVRMAYLHGFANAMEFYSTAIGQSIRASVSKNQSLTPPEAEHDNESIMPLNNNRWGNLKGGVDNE